MILTVELIGGPRDGEIVNIDPAGGVPKELHFPFNEPPRIINTEEPITQTFKVHVYSQDHQQYVYKGVK